MDEAKRRLVVAWVVKADDDLRVARLLILEENALYAAGVYHCQQAAEKAITGKAIKAWLTCHHIIFPKTHDLEALLHLCRPQEPGFSAYAAHARVLTLLATEFRYPSDVHSPAPEHARDVLGQASEIVTYAGRLVDATLDRGREAL